MDSCSEEKRKLHQKELALALNEAARLRLAKQSIAQQAQNVGKSNISYKSLSQMPQVKEIEDLKIYIGLSNYIFEYIFM